MRTHSLPACCGSVYTPIISRWWKNVTGHHCGKPRWSGPCGEANCDRPAFGDAHLSFGVENYLLGVRPAPVGMSLGRRKHAPSLAPSQLTRPL